MKTFSMPRFMGTLFFASMLTLSAEAAQINTIIDTGSGMFGEPEKVYEEIDASIQSWFYPNKEERSKLTFSQRKALGDPSQLVFIPIAESDGLVQIYREERGAAASTDATITAGQVRDTTLTREDMVNLCHELGADYILYFRVNNSIPKASVGFMSAGQKTNVTTDFRIWNAKQGKYVFVKRYLTTGASNTIYARGMGSSSHAVRNGLNKALKEIDKDKDKFVPLVK